MTLQRFSSNKNSLKYDFKQSFKSLVFPSIFLASIMIFNIYLVYEYFISQGLDGINAKGVNFFGAIIGKEYTTFCFNESASISEFICYLAICGFLFALFSFLPFMKKKCVNFYHSSPVTRNDLFKNRILSSVILMAGILLVGVAVVTSFNLIVIDDKAFIIKYALAYYAECFVYLLVSFSISCLALSLANTFIEGVILSGGLIALPSIIVFSLDNFYQVLLKGYSRVSDFTKMFKGYYDYSFVGLSLIFKTSLLNPLLFGADMKTHSIRGSIIASANYEQYEVEGIGTQYKFFLPTPSQYIPVIIWAVVSVALLFLAGYVFNKRKVENAGIHGSNKHINLFVALEFAFFFSSAVTFMLGTESVALFVATAIILFVLSLIVFYSISIRKIKHSKKAITFATAVTLCFSLFIGIISTGAFGYTYYVPKADDIEMVTVTGTGVSADGSATNWLNDGIDICCLSRWGAMGIFTEKDSIDKFVDIAEHLGDKSDNMSTATVDIIYKLKNGKKVYRTYNSLDSNVMKSFIQLVDTKEYENTFYDSLVNNSSDELIKKSKEIDLDYSMYYSEYEIANLSSSIAFLTKTGSESIEIKNTKELRKAIAQDYVNATYDELYFSNEMPVCSIGFVVPNEEEYYDGKEASIDEYYNSSFAHTYYIFPSMKNTINYLNSLGELDKIQEYDGFKTIDCIYIDSVNNVANKNSYLTSGVFADGYYSYNYSAGDDNDFERMFDCVNNPQNKITDKAEIDKYLSNATTFRYVTAEDKLMLVQGTNEQGEQIFVQLIVTNN